MRAALRSLLWNMYGDPRAKFYYPDELRRFFWRGLSLGVIVGALPALLVFFFR